MICLKVIEFFRSVAPIIIGMNIKPMFGMPSIIEDLGKNSAFARTNAVINHAIRKRDIKTEDKTFFFLIRLTWYNA